MLAGNSAYVPPTIAFESIATQTLGSNATSITFSSIPSTYKHLQIRYSGRQTGSGITDITLTFNSDGTSGNYSKHWLFTFDGGGPYTSSGGSTPISLGYLYGGDSGVMSSGIIDVLDYQNSNKYKTVKYLTGNEKSSTQTTTVVIGSGAWYSSNAINSLTLSCSTIEAGSTFALYGIEG